MDGDCVSNDQAGEVRVTGRVPTGGKVTNREAYSCLYGGLHVNETSTVNLTN